MTVAEGTPAATQQKLKREECGLDRGTVQHVDIAWPNGRHWACWLHPECEQACAARLEREWDIHGDWAARR
jgi:hypothetical protein